MRVFPLSRQERGRLNGLAEWFDGGAHALMQNGIQILRNLFYQPAHLGQVLLPVLADAQYRGHQLAGVDLLVMMLRPQLLETG